MGALIDRRSRAMMLPNTPESVLPTPAATPVSPSINPTPADVDDIRPEHADYNLHKLAVHSLGHYVIHDDEDERFHVS
jgi:hypothetical protein